MPLSDEEESELRDVLKPIVEEYIAQLSSMQSFKNDSPTVTLWRYDSANASHVQDKVLQPSKLMKPYERFSEYHTEKLADILDENVAELLERGYDFSIAHPSEYSTDPPSQTNIAAGRVRYLLSKLIADTLDYAGKFEFDEDAFDAVFEDTIPPLYNHFKDFEYVIPISGLAKSFSAVKLSPHESEFEDGSSSIAEFVSDLELGPLTESEMSGIWTVDAGLNAQSFTSRVHDSPSELGVRARIRGTVRVKDRSKTKTPSIPSNAQWEQMGVDLMQTEAERALKLLRLYGPERDQVKLGHIFVTRPHWITYREGIEHLSVRKSVPDPWVRSYWSYEFDDDDATTFREYWEEYGELLSEESVSQPLRRFNQSFDKNSLEDRLIDCFLGFESSLMKGPGHSYAFRLPGRATLLLADQVDEPRFVYEFFSALRECRNTILHSNVQLDEITLNNIHNLSENLRDEGDILPRKFVVQAQVFLSKILLKYMDLMIEEDASIHDINTELLEPTMKDLIANPNKIPWS